MSYLLRLHDEDILYICRAIPEKDTISYFQQNPKEFAKICPGFRPAAITRLDVGDLLFRNRKRGFISTFIEKHLEIWINSIQKEIETCLNRNEGFDFAYFQVIPNSFFANNVSLYFKLINEEHTDEFVRLMELAIKTIKSETHNSEVIKSKVRSKESQIKQLKSELTLTKFELENIVTKNEDVSEIIRGLKTSILEYEKTIEEDEKYISQLKSKISENERVINKWSADIKVMKRDLQQFQTNIDTKLQKEVVKKAIKKPAKVSLRCPKDRQEFQEYLGYNLENIGVSSNSEYFHILNEYIDSILFQGLPIIVNQKVAIPIIKCISNTLTGECGVNSLTYHSGITYEIIETFVKSTGRVCCLENFIGNFNETELVSILDKFKDKIIFITVYYDRTLSYVSAELFKYCNYLNLNRIEAFSKSVEITEDASTLEETELIPQNINIDSRYSLLLKDILIECGVDSGISTYKCLRVENEQHLIRTLAFDLLPYCVDVKHINPYLQSQRLVKYAGENGRCRLKNLFQEWFSR